MGRRRDAIRGGGRIAGSPPMSNRPQLLRVILGNPANRRVRFYQAALERLGCSPARVVAYRDLLEHLDFGFLASGDILRIESPGEDFEVEKRLIALGAEQPDAGGTTELSRASSISADAALRLVFDRGRLRFNRQWFCGFRRLMHLLDRQAPAELTYYNTPTDIVKMFDKPACQSLLGEHGIATPDRLGEASDFQSLAAAVANRGWNRVFVKLSHGSSASGVAAVHFHSEGVVAVTSVESTRDQRGWRYHNNLALQTYSDPSEIRRLIDFLFAEGAYAEQWRQKAKLCGDNFDVRVLVVAGQPSHVVARSSRSPLTNLHLGNQRGNVDALRSKMGATRWGRLMQAAADVAKAFPDSVHLGVDIMVGPGFRNPTVLEVNAFGDLLPGITHGGRDAYESQILCEHKILRRGPVNTG